MKPTRVVTKARWNEIVRADSEGEWEQVLVREDGWSLGFNRENEKAAWKAWAGEWVWYFDGQQWFDLTDPVDCEAAMLEEC
jgi:hypothetical protein